MWPYSIHYFSSTVANVGTHKLQNMLTSLLGCCEPKHARSHLVVFNRFPHHALYSHFQPFIQILTHTHTYVYTYIHDMYMHMFTFMAMARLSRCPTPLLPTSVEGLLQTFVMGLCVKYCGIQTGLSPGGRGGWAGCRKTPSLVQTLSQQKHVYMYVCIHTHVCDCRHICRHIYI